MATISKSPAQASQSIEAKREGPERLLPIIATFLDEPESGVPFATTLTGYHPCETR